MAATAAPITSASLYVGDLDKDVTEAQLYELFSQVGPVASIRVCRDAVTRRSLGYAYVNYNSALDENAAERAMEALNYTPINNIPVRIMWSHRDPSARRSNVGNIFIKNLDESIDNKALHDTFSQFGNILSCKVAADDGKSKGYGFVHFETQEAADLAVEKVNGMLLEGKKVFVGPFVKKTERLGPGEKDPKFTNVYVKNLDLETTEEELSKKFAEFGETSNLVIMKDENGKSRGFGFVNFRDAEDARKAVDGLNGQTVGNKAIFVGRAMKKAERDAILRKQFEEKRQERIQKYQGVNLYVKNLDDKVDDEQLRKEFEGFGTITSAKVMKDDKGQNKGFGFVCFTSPEEATKAVTDTNGRMVNGKPIYVALAQRKEVRKAQLEQHYAQRMGMVSPRPPNGVMPNGVPGGPPMFPAGTPVFYAPPGAVPPGPQRGGMIYQPVMARGAWQARGPPGVRPGFGQPVPGYVQVPMGQRGQPRQGGRQQRQQGPPAQGQPMQGQPPNAQQQPKPGQPGQPQQRGQNQRTPGGPMKYVPNGRPREGGPMMPQGMQPQMVPPPGAMGVPVPVPVGPGMVSGMSGPVPELTPSMLAAAPPQQQKQMLGERIFPLVQRLQPELAGKITGMLLEMDNSELLLLLESSEALASKVDEAISVLRQHQQIPGEAPEGQEGA